MGWRSRFFLALSYRMVVRGSACRAAICTSRRSTPASSMVVTCAEHVRVHARKPDPRSGGQTPQPSGGGVAIHPGATGVEQDRPGCSGVHRPVHRSPHGRWQGHEDDSSAFADYPQHPVPVLFSKVGDLGAGCFEDPQPEQAQHGDQSESDRFADLRAAVSIASNWRGVRPSVGDSGGTVGRRSTVPGGAPRRRL
jgi:hypothetical protein